MNIVCVPFHDYKVALSEGFRTRDTHIYGSWSHSDKVDKVVIFNRPTLVLEKLLGRKELYTKGDVIYSVKNLRIVEVSKNVFVVDVKRKDVVGPVVKGKRFIPELYSRSVNEYKKALDILGVIDFVSYESSPLTRDLVDKIKPKKRIFDGVDNFCKHDSYQPLKKWLEFEYEEIISSYDYIYFNSKDSINYFNCEDKPNVEFLPNGVDFSKFKCEYDKPKLLKEIGGKIAIYAGKMQSMFDVDLVRKCAESELDINWVFLGKVLDGNIKESLSDLENVYFLGDIHYDKLPEYIVNADVCIIPYRVENQHGGDPIKFYEYFASGLPIVSTPIGEIAIYNNDVDVFIVEKSLFIDAVSKAENCKRNELRKLPQELTWIFKSNYMLNKISEV
ncbi:glycosyltransferase [Pseudoalteromonas piscicida]|uniref:Glycosyltransferase family 1 protein n=1 Tax=Pseudoalteromonas piscicida TaxID=43662 RepID=A0A2A5JWB1_PSEO7|nr:glycosyltransferase [Pseudoalteromonas piscicida]PCK33629.1 hypothetical protein CEX98_01020 [Pseudoalteromonas piscicida]